MSKLKITAGDVRAALMRRYCAPQHALFFEVRDATGFAGSRSADAIAMGLWPSQGLHLSGFEIKVSRSDWRVELAKPEKAETIAAYCDFWHVVTAPGVILDVGEVPAAWGWIELVAGKLVTRKAAEKRLATVCDRAFLAALLRRADKADEETVAALVAKRDEERKAAFDQRLADEVGWRTRHFKELQDQVAAFEKASGLSLKGTGWGEAASMGRAVRVLLDSGVISTYSGLAGLASTLRHAAERIDKAMQGVPGAAERVSSHAP